MLQLRLKRNIIGKERMWKILNIKERREQLGISQGELAKRCGIAQSTLCDIEKGRNNPSISVAIKLANELDIKYINFFKKEG